MKTDTIEEYVQRFRAALTNDAPLRALYAICEEAQTRTSVPFRLSLPLSKVPGIDTTSRDKLENSLGIITVEQWLKRHESTILETPGIGRRTFDRIDESVAKVVGHHLSGISGKAFYCALAVGIVTTEQLLAVPADQAAQQCGDAWPELAKRRREIREELDA